MAAGIQVLLNNANSYWTRIPDGLHLNSFLSAQKYVFCTIILKASNRTQDVVLKISYTYTDKYFE